MEEAKLDLSKLADLTQWHRQQVAAYTTVRAQELEPAARQLETFLQAIVNEIAHDAKVAVRVKSVLSFAEKIIRDDRQLRHTEPLHLERGLSDLIGGQIITYTQHDADRICRHIEKLARDAEKKRIKSTVESWLEIDFDNSVDTQTRLKPAEFGYTARHFIARFHGTTLLEDSVPIDKISLCQRRLEIQVCPMIAQAWNGVTHDRVYKGDLAYPDELQRKVAAAKAMLDTAQRQLDDTLVALDSYRKKHAGWLYSQASTDGAYRTTLNGFTRAKLVCSSVLADQQASPESRQSAAETLADLAAAEADWVTAGQTLRSATGDQTQVTVKTLPTHTRLAQALIKSSQLTEARSLLDAILACDATDADAACAMAALLIKDAHAGDEQFREAARILKAAFECHPREPQLLVAMATALFLRDCRVDRIDLMTGALDDAISECRKRLELTCDMPSCLFQSARLLLFRGDAFAAANNYCLAALSGGKGEAINEERAVIQLLRGRLPHMQGDERQTNFRAALECADELLGLLNHKTLPIDPHRYDDTPDFTMLPIVIVAGGCDDRYEGHLKDYSDLLIQAFKRFRGTIISGGTRAGISGIVGDVCEKYSGQIRAVGYLPPRYQVAEAQDAVDENTRRYALIVEVSSIEPDARPVYSPLGPIRTWQHLLAAGVDPGKVRMVGINGGTVSGFEFRLAVAMGATAGLIENSGRAVATLLTDRHWKDKKGVVRLSADQDTVEMFVNHYSEPPGQSGGRLSSSDIQSLAQAFHKEYQRRSLVKKEYVDASVLPWDEGLPSLYKESTLSQVQAMQWILGTQHFAIVSSADPGDPIDLGIDDPSKKDPEQRKPQPNYLDRLTLMAQLEHGRWMAERLTQGFRYGRVRSLMDKTNPNILSWKDLSDEIRGWDMSPYIKLAREINAYELNLKIIDLKAQKAGN